MFISDGSCYNILATNHYHFPPFFLRNGDPHDLSCDHGGGPPVRRNLERDHVLLPRGEVRHRGAPEAKLPEERESEDILVRCHQHLHQVIVEPEEQSKLQLIRLEKLYYC